MRFKIIVGAIIACVLFISFSTLYTRNKELNRQLESYKTNEKALIKEQDSIKNESTMYKLTIAQLNYFNDSISQKFNNVLKEYNITRDKLSQLSYIKSELNKVDTLLIRDTLFIENTNIDTLVGNKWLNTRLKLEYPNKISLDTKVTSELFIVATNKKETIDPPKKFFLTRWFQKKHIVVEVKTIEKNPYMINKEQRFIHIID